MTYLKQWLVRFQQILLYGGLEQTEYRTISSDINESNRHTVVLASAVCAVIFFVRLHVIPVELSVFNQRLYVGAILLFIALALSNHFIRENRYLIHSSAYLFLITYLSIGALAAVGTTSVQERTTLYLVFLFSAPVLFALNALELTCIIVPEEICFIALITKYQSMYPVYKTNVNNSIFFAVSGLILGVYMSNMKVSGIYNAYKNAHLEKIQELNEQLQKSQDELHAALIAAERANQAKTTFLNSMSHDIRTPMNAILGFASLAQSHIEDRARVYDYLQKISLSGQHLLSLINDVLDMSRIESGKIIMYPQSLSLAKLMDELETITRVDAQAKHLELSVSVDIQHDYILADKLRLNQILLNIVGNAIKFTPAGGSVSIKLTESVNVADEESTYTFSIKDTGIGMSKEFQKHIFEAFSRDENTVNSIQGTGLGMSITKNLVDLMHGTIDVDSTEGIGSEFIVSLPFLLDHAPVIPQTSAETYQVSTFSGKRVLLAEDNELNQELAAIILQENGFEVDIANDGAIAVQTLQDAAADRYDAILMDIQMPNMNGYEAMRKIRALDDAQKANIPIIAMTANAFDSDTRRSLDAGMNGHLSKPIDTKKLLETLHTLLP